MSDLLTDDLKWNKQRIEKILPEFADQIQSETKLKRSRRQLCMAASSFGDLFNSIGL